MGSVLAEGTLTIRKLEGGHGVVEGEVRAQLSRLLFRVVHFLAASFCRQPAEKALPSFTELTVHAKLHATAFRYFCEGLTRGASSRREFLHGIMPICTLTGAPPCREAPRAG